MGAERVLLNYRRLTLGAECESGRLQRRCRDRRVRCAYRAVHSGATISVSVSLQSPSQLITITSAQKPSEFLSHGRNEQLISAHLVIA